MSNLEVALPQEINILIVFIHGFKGNDDTFAKFPERLQHTLSQSIPSSKVECIVFPAYETKGDLNEAVIRLADWLTTITVNREVASGGGAGKVRIVLCGHSMGGLLAADSLLEFLKTRPDQEAPLWPNIVACIAFDTPYLGLHPSVFKNSAAQAVEYATTAHTAVTGLLTAFGGWKATSTTNQAQRKSVAAITAPPATQPATSAWGRWAPAAIAAGSALAAGAAAGGLYYQRDTLGEGYKWFADHMKYVGTLWNEESLKRRLEALADAQEQHGVVFRTFYTLVPATPPAHLNPRTFVVLPPQSSRTRPYFVPASNSLATDELKAHTGMFSGSTNDGYYELGLDVAKIVRQAVLSSGDTGREATAAPPKEKEEEGKGENLLL